MTLDTRTLIWLFPIAFMFHDFEELILFEPWLKKNAGEIRARMKNKIPLLIEKQIDGVLGKTTIEFGVPISLIFALTCIAAFLAAVYAQYGLFIWTSGLFFIHGFMHLGQAVLMRRYIPASISSALVVIPYGIVLFTRLITDGIVTFPSLLLYWLYGAVLGVPFMLGMHQLGDMVYRVIMRLFIDPIHG